jgi:homoserine kinase
VTTEASAFAPATVANVAAGFDVLGFAVAGIGDRVRIVRDEAVPGIVVDGIEGVVTELPTDPARNTASVAARSLFDAVGERGGFRLSIEKGIALGSGMGGSAASAVAAVVAANALLPQPVAVEALLPHAAQGEAAASGAPHADNVAPCLLGGLTAIVAHDPVRAISIPTPDSLRYVLVRPDLRLDTREARAALPAELPLGMQVEQAQYLAGFLAGCFRGDMALIRNGMRDLIATPARSRLIPGCDQALEAAACAGALGAGIAGAGPSLFAWAEGDAPLTAIERGMRTAFEAEGLATEAWSGPIAAQGAGVEAAG